MPRSVSGGRHNRCVDWWTPNIAEMRASCVRARRRLLRARRRRRIRDEAEITRYYEAYRETRRTLQREIKIVKARSWTEMVESVESDPQGRPYRLVTEKFDLRPHSPLTAHMDPMLLMSWVLCSYGKTTMRGSHAHPPPPAGRRRRRSGAKSYESPRKSSSKRQRGWHSATRHRIRMESQAGFGRSQSTPWLLVYGTYSPDA